MKNLLKLEEAGMLAMCIYALYVLHAPWWCYILLAFGPDIGMLGYMLGNRVGMVTYNLLHHKAVAAALIFAGFFADERAVGIAGIIMFGHASLDRIFGYGLKLQEGFKFTHLGEIGKK